MTTILTNYLYFKNLFFYGSLGRVYNNLLIPLQRYYCMHKRYRFVLGLLGFILQLLHTILLELLYNERSPDYFPQIRYPRRNRLSIHRGAISINDFTLELSLALYSILYYFVIRN